MLTLVSEFVNASNRISLIVATKNKGKLREFMQIFERLPFDIISMTDAGINDDIDETGSSFEENALIKARAVWKASGRAVIADDSGLEVDALNGAPGIYSARYAGCNVTDRDRNEKLLEALKDVPQEKRTARFVCAVALVLPSGRSLTVRGTCEGNITFEPAGCNGFGYDPLFYVPEFGLTIAQMDSDTKNKISHRGKALREMVKQLEFIWRDA
jgi:XTP/dITP diphosphohydrolase